MKKYAPTSQTPPWSKWTTTQKTQTYDAVKAAGEEGITREDICTKTGLQKQRVWFYLSELRRQGMIKRLGDAVDPATLSPEESRLHALVAMENALVITAKKTGITKEMREGFSRYQKIKAIALQPIGSHGDSPAQQEAKLNQAKVAMRQAIIDLVKLIFGVLLWLSASIT